MLHSDWENRFPQLSDLVESIAFFRMRRRVRRDYSLRRTKREEAFEQIEKNQENAERLGFKTAAEVFNAAMFVLLLDQDLQDYVLQMVHARGHRSRVFVSRGLAVLLYEATEDLPELFGKKYRKCLGEIQPQTELIESLNRSIAEINTFKRRHREALLEIRRFVGAHRDKDAKKQIEILRRIDPMVISNLAVEFSVGHRLLSDTQIQIIMHLGTHTANLAKIINRMADDLSEQSGTDP